MFRKKYKIFLIFFISLITISIIIYKITFYTPPLLDSGKRNIIEKTIDFLWFGWHFTKASIHTKYHKNSREANKEIGRAAWYRKKYLLKRFRLNEEDLISILEVYKKLNINSILEDLYIFSIREKNNEISFLHEAGERFIIWKNWKKVSEVFSKAIDSYPDDVMSYYYLGLSYLYLKKLNKANEYLEKVTELKPYFADAYFRLGIIAEKEKKWNTAQGLYEKTINILPNHLDSLKALKKINEKLE
jgi:tetratricopeptide (TPR) repeat protein